GYDQLFELDLQAVEVPLPLFRETIDREPQHALLLWTQVPDANARDKVKAQLPSGLVANLATDKFVIATHKEGNAKAESADRRCNLPNVCAIQSAEFSRRRSKVSDRNIGKLESWEDIVSPRAYGRSLGQSLLPVTTKAALFAQLVGEGGLRRN